MMLFYLPVLIAAFLLTLFFLLRSFKNFIARKPVTAAVQLLTSFSTALITALTTLFLLSTWGYSQLTTEQDIASIDVTHVKSQQFKVNIQVKNQNTFHFQVSGDEIYIDAYLIKWHPWANLLGFKTLYKLDRIGGRYFSYEDELHKSRSLFRFHPQPKYDLFNLLKKYPWLDWLVDAKYGNAAFVPLKDNQHIQLTLANSGLILREQMMSSK